MRRRAKRNLNLVEFHSNLKWIKSSNVHDHLRIWNQNLKATSCVNFRENLSIKSKISHFQETVEKIKILCFKLKTESVKKSISIWIILKQLLSPREIHLITYPPSQSQFKETLTQLQLLQNPQQRKLLSKIEGRKRNKNMSPNQKWPYTILKVKSRCFEKKTHIY